MPRLPAIALLLLFAGPALAEEPVRITAVRVGLPAAPRGDTQPADVARFACWAPVYVDLEPSAPPESAELVITSADPDEIATSLALSISPGQRTVIGDVRPGGVGEVTVTVRAKDGGKPLSEPFRVRSLRPRDPLTYVVLSLGSPLPNFDLPRPIGVSAEQSPG